jgi:hypothetical protein
MKVPPLKQGSENTIKLGKVQQIDKAGSKDTT